MAITNGVAINCDDLQQIGGIKHILLRDWATSDDILYGTGDTHSITSIQATGASHADWFMYEFKSQNAAMTINATKENGSTSFECGLNFMLPRMTSLKFHELQNMLTDCMMAIAVDNNDNAFVLGVSELYRNSSVSSRSQTFLNLSTIEGGTGTAYDDDNGVTVTLMCKQYELPRAYTGTITYYTDATPSVTLSAKTT